MAASVDNSKLIEAFRAAARKRGIDPAAGATVYEAVKVRAELAETCKRLPCRTHVIDDGTGAELRERVNRPTEYEAMLLVDGTPAPPVEPPLPIIITRDAAIMAYLLEGMREAATALKHDLPLTDIHAYQKKRARAKWVPMAGGIPQRVYAQVSL